jgi:hypothetical protein
MLGFIEFVFELIDLLSLIGRALLGMAWKLYEHSIDCITRRINQTARRAHFP